MLNLILFADDGTVYATHCNIICLIQTVNDEIVHVRSWLKANKLALNLQSS